MEVNADRPGRSDVIVAQHPQRPPMAQHNLIGDNYKKSVDILKCESNLVLAEFKEGS
jgi:hypothetical protein